MAGLYAKELMARGDVTRLLIVAPGGLVEQSQDELALRFGHPRRAAHPRPDCRYPRRQPVRCAPAADRPDGSARPRRAAAGASGRRPVGFDVLDEAHRMSASWIGHEIRRTRRYELGQRISSVSRHLLLMTATPHAGSEENYQLFLALLDPDRFEGRYVPDVHSWGHHRMRRMVKEELLTLRRQTTVSRTHRRDGALPALTART